MYSQRPSPLKRFFLGLLYVGWCALFLGSGYVLHWVGNSTVLTEFLKQSIENTKPQEIFNGKSSLTMLVLGCDEDVSYGGLKVLKKQARSDMMLVAKLDFDNNRISGVAIPRDLLVALPGYKEQKINAYHAIGGKELAQQAVEQVLGIPIDRTVTLDYEAFQQMVDLVGGVEVFISKVMKYSDKRANPPLIIDFKPGRRLLDGYQAMCFVRFRHSDDDFKRQDRQRDFMLSFKESVMKQPGLINQVADKALAVLGGGFNGAEMAAVARFSRGVRSESIALGQIPVLEAPHYNLILDEAKLPATLKKFHLIESNDAVSMH